MSKFTFTEPVNVLLVFALPRVYDVRRKDCQLGSTFGSTLNSNKLDEKVQILGPKY